MLLSAVSTTAWMGSFCNAFLFLHKQSIAGWGWNPSCAEAVTSFTCFFPVKLLHEQIVCLVTWECTNPYCMESGCAPKWSLLLLLLLRAT